MKESYRIADTADGSFLRTPCGRPVEASSEEDALRMLFMARRSGAEGLALVRAAAGRLGRRWFMAVLPEDAGPVGAAVPIGHVPWSAAVAAFSAAELDEVVGQQGGFAVSRRSGRPEPGVGAVVDSGPRADPMRIVASVPLPGGWPRMPGDVPRSEAVLHALSPERLLHRAAWREFLPSGNMPMEAAARVREPDGDLPLLAPGMG